MKNLRPLKIANHIAAALLGLGFIALGFWGKGDAHWLRRQLPVFIAYLILLPAAAAFFNRLVLPACARRRFFLLPALGFVAVYLYLVFFAYNLFSDLGGASPGYARPVWDWFVEPIASALWGVGALIPIWLVFGFGLGFFFRRFAGSGQGAEGRGRA